MRKFIDRFGFLSAVIIVFSTVAWSQTPSGVPSRLRVAALGVNVAVPAGSGDIVAQDDITATDDLNANDAVITTSATLAGSAMLTRATSGRIAWAQINGATGAMTNAFNMTSGSRIGAGQYSVNLTAAGITLGQCFMTTNQTQRYCIANSGGINVTLGVSCVDPATNVLTDANFSVMCVGT